MNEIVNFRKIRILVHVRGLDCGYGNESDDCFRYFSTMCYKTRDSERGQETYPLTEWDFGNYQKP